MPTYAKFIKEIVTKNMKVGKYETVDCFALSKLPPKQKDLGSFIIPYSIGDIYVGMTLCDIGSSVNLMAKLIFFKLEMGNTRLTSIIFSIAYHSHVRPKERVEDVIMRMDKFVFPMDFHILDCEVDNNAPIILGSPFLATGRILIDCKKSELTMRVADQCLTVNVFRTQKYFDDSEECKIIFEVDSLIEVED
ncbi:uncharacterized protein LOC120179222 [Hibiscus syriacus]|uniref:uncharacterized protein LOC120179222 n=1 Tax=Hibiscus syriacus TaxID=106335 RepID=UPI0019222EF7|nr:uncharacterized protein LOC120179222 [Hibiscus syriacus]